MRREQWWVMSLSGEYQNHSVVDQTEPPSLATSQVQLRFMLCKKLLAFFIFSRLSRFNAVAQELAAEIRVGYFAGHAMLRIKATPKRNGIVAPATRSGGHKKRYQLLRYPRACGTPQINKICQLLKVPLGNGWDKGSIASEPIMRFTLGLGILMVGRLVNKSQLIGKGPSAKAIWKYHLGSGTI